MSFYSRLDLLLKEHKLTRADFPIQIKRTRHGDIFTFESPEEFLLFNSIGEWKLLQTKVYSHTGVIRNESNDSR